MSTWLDLTFGNNIQEGPEISQAVFNYVKVSAALDSLAEKANFWWAIDPYKKLFFVAKTAYAAPFPITPNICEHGSINVKNGNNQYRNTQYIKGARDITDPQTETRKGDGETQSFFTGFALAKVPTIEISINGGAFAAQTVGIRGLDTGKQWYWSKGENVISQEGIETPLTDLDVWKIVYQGEFDVVIVSKIDDEIFNQATIDGTSGIVEDVADEPNTTGRTAAYESANAKLARYGVIGRTIVFRTWKKGLSPGMLLTIEMPEYGLDGVEMLIESIAITREDNDYWYIVQAVEGPANQSWTKFFGSLSTTGLVVRENAMEDQIVVTVSEFTKTWEEADNPNIYKRIYAADTLFLSDTLFPSFQNDERVLYFSWYTDGVEIGRKEITQQTLDIRSVTFLSPLDANVNISHVGWWGGISATDALGTGVLVDYQVYDKVKTQLEAIQVDKLDILDFVLDTGDLLLTASFFQALDDSVEKLLLSSI